MVPVPAEVPFAVEEDPQSGSTSNAIVAATANAEKRKETMHVSSQSDP
jgi:hypothetical protein